MHGRFAGKRRRQFAKPRMAGEGNWLITSLIVIMLVLLLVAIVSFLVVAFMGNALFENVGCGCPACPTGAGVTFTEAAQALAPGSAVPAEALLGAALGLPVSVDLGTGATGAAGDNRLEQTLILDGRRVAALSRRLAPRPTDPQYAAAVAAERALEATAPKPEAPPRSFAERAAARAQADRESRRARTRQRQADARRSAVGAAPLDPALFELATDSLPPSQAAALVARHAARVADLADAAAVNAGGSTAEAAAGPAVSNAEAAAGSAVSTAPGPREAALDATVRAEAAQAETDADGLPADRAAPPIGGARGAGWPRQVLRLQEARAVPAPGGGLRLTARLSRVAARAQGLVPQLRAVPLVPAPGPCPWPALTEPPAPRLRAGLRRSPPEQPSTDAAGGQLLWRGVPIAVDAVASRLALELDTGLDFGQPQPVALDPAQPPAATDPGRAWAEPTWAATWALRIELAPSDGGAPLAAARARPAAA